MAVQTQIQTRRGTAATWTSTNPTLAAGEIGFESDTGKFKIGTGSTAWNSLAYSAGATAVTYLFNATAGQTTFSGADANSLTLAYTVGAEQVYLNGALQVRGSDYTATNGTSIVLTSGAVVSDVLNVIAYSALTITDTYTQAQADAKFVQQTTNFFAGKNKIINGDFGVWQRGTSINLVSATGTYTADRFKNAVTFSAGTCTVSRQAFTPGTAPVTGYEGAYFQRTTLPASGSITYYETTQFIEGVQTYAGQTVTLSFWAKASSAVTLTSLFTQNFGSGGSTNVDTGGSTHAVTTSWQRFTVTIAMPSIAGKTIGTSSYIGFYLYTTTGLTTSMTIDIWGVQVEAGSLATPFTTATGTIQGELAACQRYYYRTLAGGNQTVAFGGNIPTTAIAVFNTQLPVPLRGNPTFGSGTAASLAIGYGANLSVNAATIVADVMAPNYAQWYVTVAGTPFTTGGAARATSSASTGWVEFSAEL